MLVCSPRIADDTGLASPYVQFIFPPPTRLADYVASFWVLLSRPHLPAPVLEHAFPSLGVKLIFNLGAPVRSASIALEPSAAASAIPPRAYLLGPRTTSVDLTLAPSTMLIGVQFTPAGAYPFVQSSLHALTNRGVALDMVWPDIVALDERLAAATMQQQITLLAQLLTKQLERKHNRQLVARQVIALLHTMPDHRSIHQIAASLGISRRHLARLFLIQVGMSPKRCARMLRFQQALRQLTQHPHMPTAHIAALGGYADQSHFIREFRTFAGLPPNTYRRHAQRVPNIQYIQVPMCYSGSGAGTIIWPQS